VRSAMDWLAQLFASSAHSRFGDRPENPISFVISSPQSGSMNGDTAAVAPQRPLFADPVAHLEFGDKIDD